jgi:cytochrome c-type biogenesis protein
MRPCLDRLYQIAKLADGGERSGLPGLVPITSCRERRSPASHASSVGRSRSVSATGVGYLAAFAGGLVSFASPCVLPVVPAYLSVITGLEIGEIERGRWHHLWRIARDTGLFIAGFSMVFIMLGVTATALARMLAHWQALITRVSGLLVLAFALFIVGSLVLKPPLLYQERRFHPRLSRYGPFAAPVAGVAFGFGWTPCIGPVLGSVLAIASTRADAVQGATLLAAYSLGLGVPFLATGLAFGRMASAFRWVKRHYAAITITSACVLGFFGVLLTLNRLTWVTGQLQAVTRHLGLGSLNFLG